MSKGDVVEIQYYGKARQFEVVSALAPSNLQTPQSRLSVQSEKQTDLLESFKTMAIEERIEKEERTLEEKSRVQRDIKECEAKGSQPLHTLSAITGDDCKSYQCSENLNSPKIHLGLNNTEAEICSSTLSCLNSSESLFCYISSTMTNLIILPAGKEMKQNNQGNSKVTFASIGGLSRQIQLVRETIEMLLKHPELFTSYGKYFNWTAYQLDICCMIYFSNILIGSGGFIRKLLRKPKEGGSY